MAVSIAGPRRRTASAPAAVNDECDRDRSGRSPSPARTGRQHELVPADLQIDPDAVDGMARRARRVADDLGTGPADVGGATAVLLAFAEAAEHAARRARDADRDAADRLR